MLVESKMMVMVQDIKRVKSERYSKMTFEELKRTLDESCARVEKEMDYRIKSV